MNNDIDEISNSDVDDISSSDVKEDAFEEVDTLSGLNDLELAESLESIKDIDGENDYKYEKNDNDQIIRASGDLRLEEGERNQYAQRIAGGDSRRDSDDGGHLIATRFGGSGELENLVPEDSHVNRSAFKSIENQWAKDLEAGKDVHVDIEPIYHGDSLRPDVITAKTEVTDGENTVVDYYSVTNENLESEEFLLPKDADEMLDLWDEEDSEDN